MFPSEFQSFSRSPLGAFIESPLGVRGGGIEGTVFVGGSMTTPFRNIGVYDYAANAYGSFGNNSNIGTSVLSICLHNGEVHVSVTPNGIRKWDGSAWVSLGSFADVGYSSVTSLRSSNGKLYAAGAGNSKIAREWVSGTTWQDTGSGATWSSGGTTARLTDFGGTLWACGGTLGQARFFDGASWSAPQGTIGTNPFDIDGSASLICTVASRLTGYPAFGDLVGKWDGSEWAGFASHLSPTFGALTAYNVNQGSGLTALFTTGGRVFTSSGGAWSNLGLGGIAMNSGPSQDILVVPDGSILVGGNFSSAFSISPCNRLARYNGGAWGTVGSNNLNGQVACLELLPYEFPS